MKEVKFGKIIIGDNKPCVIIVDACDNHGGSVDSAKKMVDQAIANGADIIKFQLHLPEIEMVPNSIKLQDVSLTDILMENLLSLEDHKIIKEYCESHNIMYLCTPFCPQAADDLEKIGVDAFKIGSGEMTNLPIIRGIAQKGIPMMISTGMSTLEEIKTTVDVVEQAGAPYVIAHCISEYPTDYANLNLNLLKKYKEEFKVPIGFSDHALGIYSSLAAVALGANFIEKHFTQDKTQKGADHSISIDPDDLKEMSTAIRLIEKGLCAKKVISSQEQVIRNWAHHSVVVNKELIAGTILTEDVLTVKRPGSGIPAKDLERVVGRKLLKDSTADHILQWEDIS